MITLSGDAMLLGGLRSAELFAFSLDEHKQARSDLVAGMDDEVASGPDDAPICKLVDHDRVLGGGRIWLRKIEPR